MLKELQDQIAQEEIENMIIPDDPLLNKIKHVNINEKEEQMSEIDEDEKLKILMS